MSGWVRGVAARRALIGYLIFTVAIVIGFVRVEAIANQAEHDRREIEQRFQESDDRQISALRTMLCTLQENTLTSRQRTAEEKRMVIAFYQVALQSIRAKPCGPRPR